MQHKTNSDFQDFHVECGNKPFTSEYNAFLLRRMADPDEKPIEKVICWTKYWSWGKYSTIAVRKRGGPHLTQKDCSSDLGLSPPTVSKAYKNLAKRGYLIPNHGSLGFYTDPQAAEEIVEEDKAERDDGFEEFYRTAYSDRYEKLQKARQEVEEERKFERELKKWWKKSDHTSTSVLPFKNQSVTNGQLPNEQLQLPNEQLVNGEQQAKTSCQTSNFTGCENGNSTGETSNSNSLNEQLFDAERATLAGRIIIDYKKENKASTYRAGECVSYQQEAAHPPAESTNPRHQEILEAIAPICQRIGRAPDSEITAQIAEKLGDTPIEWLTHRIRERHRGITSLGLLPKLAEDAAKAYQIRMGNHDPTNGHRRPLGASNSAVATNYVPSEIEITERLREAEACCLRDADTGNTWWRDEAQRLRGLLFATKRRQA